MFTASQQSLFAGQAQRQFSSFEQIEISTQKLKKALDAEIKYEQDNYT